MTMLQTAHETTTTNTNQRICEKAVRQFFNKLGMKFEEHGIEKILENECEELLLSANLRS
jgi:uncharacterized protein YneF (UPF0154 family)